MSYICILVFADSYDYAPVTSSESEYHSLVLAEPNQPLNSKIIKVKNLNFFIEIVRGESYLFCWLLHKFRQ